MKNLISYYYNLSITQLKKRDDTYFFAVGNKNFEFIPFYGDANLLYKIYSLVRQKNIYCHEIIFNKDNLMTTIFNNIPHILIKKNISIDKYVDINEIINYDLGIFLQDKLTWKKLWEEKIDYYEYQMSQFAFKYPILKSSFNYYIGLTENAIDLLNFINADEIKYCINHKRIYDKEKLEKFFNPLEFVLDSRVRDICEYIKINYINNNLQIDEVYGILKSLNLDSSEAILMFSRLLYPSYYFDLYDRIIQEKISENKIENLIKKNAMYEAFLKKIYEYFRKKYVFPEIEWLNY